MINLGILLIVANLGTDCLLGEPAKQTNNIICLPRQKLILLASGDTLQYAKYEEPPLHYTLARTMSTTTIAPGESIQYKLPDAFASQECVAISPRPESLSWL